MAIERMRGRRDSRGLALYFLTVALEGPVILARYMAMWVVAVVALRATGASGAGAAGWAKLGLAPTLWSLAALASPAGGGWWWQQRMGGREPSRREYVAYRDALEGLEATAPILVPLPRRWFVVDEAVCDAAVCGDTLMLSRGLLESGDLAAVLAHELGHLVGIDPRLTAAVDRLRIGGWRHSEPNGEAVAPTGRGGRTVVIVNPKLQDAGLLWRLMVWAGGMTMALLRGGVALRLTAPAWGAVWREQEYEADRWAARMGEGEELADFLEREAHDHPIPMVWLTEQTHPPTELRIDRLRREAERQIRDLAGLNGGRI